MTAETAVKAHRPRRTGRARKPLLYAVASLGLLVMATPFLWMAPVSYTHLTPADE